MISQLYFQYFQSIKFKCIVNLTLKSALLNSNQKDLTLHDFLDRISPCPQLIRPTSTILRLILGCLILSHATFRPTKTKPAFTCKSSMSKIIFSMTERMKITLLLIVIRSCLRFNRSNFSQCQIIWIYTIPNRNTLILNYRNLTEIPTTVIHRSTPPSGSKASKTSLVETHNALYIVSLIKTSRRRLIDGEN